jgi:hypothetical protein
MRKEYFVIYPAFVIAQDKITQKEIDNLYDVAIDLEMGLKHWKIYDNYVFCFKDNTGYFDNLMVESEKMNELHSRVRRINSKLMLEMSCKEEWERF